MAMQREGARVRGYICFSGILSYPQGIGSVLGCCGGFISPIYMLCFGGAAGETGSRKIRQQGGRVCRATMGPEVGLGVKPPQQEGVSRHLGFPPLTSTVSGGFLFLGSAVQEGLCLSFV
jgi:hypothetical protein